MKTLAFCVDSLGHTDFCGKRQSSDRILIGKLVDTANGEAIHCSEYSQSLFPSGMTKEETDETAKKDGIHFLEGIVPDQSLYDRMIIFNWNRTYPGKNIFKVDMVEFEKASSEDFPGFSHEKITMTVYRRKQ